VACKGPLLLPTKVALRRGFVSPGPLLGDMLKAVKAVYRDGRERTAEILKMIFEITAIAASVLAALGSIIKLF